MNTISVNIHIDLNNKKHVYQRFHMHKCLLIEFFYNCKFDAFFLYLFFFLFFFEREKALSCLLIQRTLFRTVDNLYKSSKKIIEFENEHELQKNNSMVFDEIQLYANLSWTTFVFRKMQILFF